MCKKFTSDELNKMDHKTKDGVIYQMQDRLDQLEQNYENLMEQVRLANQQRFGRHTEKLEVNKIAARWPAKAVAQLFTFSKKGSDRIVPR